MLRHIVVVGEGDSLYKKVAKAVEGSEWMPVAWNAAQGVPPASEAVIGGARDVAAALQAAAAVGAAHEEVLWLLADAIDALDGIPAGGARRMTALASRFADALRLAPQDRATLERGALLHDIGKLKVSAEILLKTDLLTYHEWAALQQHPVFGAELVSAGTAFRDTADIIRHHHECYDGTGYPAGLEGEEIPFLARVAKIVDVYCAMTSPRLYRKGLTNPDQALEYFRNERGRLYDPGLIDLFLQICAAQMP